MPSGRGPSSSRRAGGKQVRVFLLVGGGYGASRGRFMLLFASSLARLSRRALQSSEQPPREVAAAGGQRRARLRGRGAAAAAASPELGPERAGAPPGGPWALGGSRWRWQDKEGRGSGPLAEGGGWPSSRARRPFQLTVWGAGAGEGQRGPADRTGLCREDPVQVGSLAGRFGGPVVRPEEHAGLQEGGLARSWATSAR